MDRRRRGGPRRRRRGPACPARRSRSPQPPRGRDRLLGSALSLLFWNLAAPPPGTPAARSPARSRSCLDGALVALLLLVAVRDLDPRRPVASLGAALYAAGDRSTWRPTLADPRPAWPRPRSAAPAGSPRRRPARRAPPPARPRPHRAPAAGELRRLVVSTACRCWRLAATSSTRVQGLATSATHLALTGAFVTAALSRELIRACSRADSCALLTQVATDPLTGLGNRRALARRSRSSHPRRTTRQRADHRPGRLQGHQHPARPPHRRRAAGRGRRRARRAVPRRARPRVPARRRRVRRPGRQLTGGGGRWRTSWSRRSRGCRGDPRRGPGRLLGEHRDGAPRAQAAGAGHRCRRTRGRPGRPQPVRDGDARGEGRRARPGTGVQHADGRAAGPTDRGRAPAARPDRRPVAWTSPSSRSSACRRCG